ncbi:NAD-dependent epimerase/dehydratase family protein [Candidatus Bathyarchaeota archaeon]|nr:NAD-dependent epimerase/dehydratase family protein [Candidatus Bathyarchaeota archaeon]
MQKLDPNTLEGKIVLITGGAGFLGSWLCDTLVSCGSKVYCIDNFSTGIPLNIDHLLKLGNFHLMRTEVEKISADIGKFDLIMHFASRASPKDYQSSPIETLTVNSIGTMKTLELARNSNSTFIYASSSEVYGDAEVIPTP